MNIKKQLLIITISILLCGCSALGLLSKFGGTPKTQINPNVSIGRTATNATISANSEKRNEVKGNAENVATNDVNHLGGNSRIINDNSMPWHFVILILVISQFVSIFIGIILGVIIPRPRFIKRMWGDE